MTDRLYFDDAYATAFQAQVIDRCDVEGKPGVVLDQTRFYPTSGGQSHDTGVLNGRAVIDVEDRGDHIVHVLAQELPENDVHGEINWSRRYDHMQQHTGQHILSETFISVLDAHTTSFHMGACLSTIDIERSPVTPSEWDAVEHRLQDIISENHPVTSYWVNPDHIEALNLRKTPERTGPLRIIDIHEIDRTACGGTHCRTTGELGMIQILDRQPKRVHGGLYRIEFVCGLRARTDYVRRIDWMNRLSSSLEMNESEVLDAINKMQTGRKEGERKIRALTEKLLVYEADELASEIQVISDMPLLTQTFTDRNADEIRLLAHQLITRHQCVVLLGGGLDKMQLIFARSHGLPYTMGTLMKNTMQHIGERGGGRPEIAMGGAPNIESVKKAIHWAKEELIKHHD